MSVGWEVPREMPSEDRNIVGRDVITALVSCFPLASAGRNTVCLVCRSVPAFLCVIVSLINLHTLNVLFTHLVLHFNCLISFQKTVHDTYIHTYNAL